MCTLPQRCFLQGRRLDCPWARCWNIYCLVQFSLDLFYCPYVYRLVHMLRTSVVVGLFYLSHLTSIVPKERRANRTFLEKMSTKHLLQTSIVVGLLCRFYCFLSFQRKSASIDFSRHDVDQTSISHFQVWHLHHFLAISISMSGWYMYVSPNTTTKHFFT